jgi:ABC-type dipeptide/oligopeptide/nickel transport system permease component
MIGHIVSRLLQVIPVLFAITLIAFLVFYLDPADPVAALTRENVSPEYAASLRARFGLDEPAHVQYLMFVEKILQGDLGLSYRSREPVIERILPAVRGTLHFALITIIFTVLIGLPVGMLAAARPYSLADNVVMIVALIGVSAPEFWVGLLLIYVFAYKLGILPSSGSFTWASVILPALTLASHYGAIVARITRTSLLEVMGEDYIRTARAKGLSERVVFNKHALRPAALPIVTMLGLQVASMVGGTILVETVFAWPGIGRLLVVAIAERDAPTVQGCIIVIAVLVVLVTLITDILYAYLNPKVRTK